MKQEEKNSGAGQTKETKLTYEQLTAYAQQISTQAKQIWEENQQLKKALQEALLNNSFRESELALKCLDHMELFSPSFIDAIVGRLEEVLSPTATAEDSTDEESKESKEE